MESFAARKRARTPLKTLSGWQKPRYTRWRTDWILSCSGGEAYGAFTAPEKSKSYGTASSGRGCATLWKIAMLCRFHTDQSVLPIRYWKTATSVMYDGSVMGSYTLLLRTWSAPMRCARAVSDSIRNP